MRTRRNGTRTIRGVLLDFYGTLVHEDDLNIAAIVDQMRAACPSDSLRDDIDRFWTDRFMTWCAVSNEAAFISHRAIAHAALTETMQRFDVDLHVETLLAPQIRQWSNPPLFDETRTFLAALDDAGIPVLVVSNVDRADIAAAIAAHELPLPDVLTSEDAHAYKPHRRIFDLALDQIGLPRDEVLHVGDSYRSDVIGARNAGIRVAWLNRSGRRPPGDTLPDIDVRSLVELAAHLQEGMP